MRHIELVKKWVKSNQGYRACGNMFYENDVIYSYGQHFPIARKVKGVTLVTTRQFSSSTAAHVYTVQCVVLDFLKIDDVLAETPEEHQSNIDTLYESHGDIMDKALRARSRKEQYLREAENVIDTIIRYKEIFNPKG